MGLFVLLVAAPHSTFPGNVKGVCQDDQQRRVLSFLQITFARYFYLACHNKTLRLQHRVLAALKNNDFLI